MAKAFNTLRAEELRTRASKARDIAIPYCCDSDATGAIRETLIQDCGDAPVKPGRCRTAR